MTCCSEKAALCPIRLFRIDFGKAQRVLGTLAPGDVSNACAHPQPFAVRTYHGLPGNSGTASLAVFAENSKLNVVPAWPSERRLQERPHRFAVIGVYDLQRIVDHTQALGDGESRHALDSGINPADTAIRQKPTLPVVSVVRDNLE